MVRPTFVFENEEDQHHRLLHVFYNHMAALQFTAKTDGLREWNAGARYFARPEEIEKHPAKLTIYH